MQRNGKNPQTSEIREWIDSFLVDRKAGGLSARTVAFYAEKLDKLATWCAAENVDTMRDISPDLVRRWLLDLEAHGHNPGGVHAFYRVAKTFLRWWEFELEPEGWQNPFRKVKAPKVTPSLLPPVPLEDIRAMVRTCPRDWYGLRDKAAMLALLDTGARAAEFLALNVDNVNLRTGAVQIEKGKGGKPRAVFIGKTTKRAMRQYLRTRKTGPLWVKRNGERLTYSGLCSILRRRAAMAGVDVPRPHAFRRAFAVNMLRAGVDLETLRRLMGHADYQVIRRYLDLLNSDLQRAHAIASPADSLKNL